MDNNEDETRWCDTHGHISPWKYEEELGGEVCALCYKEYWDNENAELWG